MCLLSMAQTVSIRSPDRSQGRQLIKTHIGVIPKFQSAPLTGARGDTISGAGTGATATFQSAPLTGARGDVLNGPSEES